MCIGLGKIMTYKTRISPCPKNLWSGGLPIELYGAGNQMGLTIYKMNSPQLIFAIKNQHPQSEFFPRQESTCQFQGLAYHEM